MTIPIVSICCITYNHAPYIRQCLDGFIMQKTNFPFEVLIHDDASTDGTADIIREYEQKHPDIIKPIYQTENQHSKGIPISRTYNFPRVQGKYIARCEGDDYWTDKYKLQKQVDFMEANEDFSICFHPVNVYLQDKRIYDNSIVPFVPAIMDIKTLALGNYIYNLSVMYRTKKQVFDDLNKFPELKIGDYLLHMLFAKYGKIMMLSDIMAVYRVHSSGIFSMKKADETHPVLLKLLEELLVHFVNDQEISNNLKEQYSRTASSLLRYYIDNNDYDSQEVLLNQINNQINKSSISLYNIIIKNLENEVKNIYISKTYRFGKLILTPFRAVRFIWKKLVKRKMQIENTLN